MIATTVLGGELALLGALSATTGLGVTGWVVGIVHALVLAVLIARGRREAGPADRVTAVRAVLGGGVTALVAAHSSAVVVLVTLAAVALALDAVDGRVARRTQTVSELGARFDMETDAFLILVLSVAVAAGLGPWVLVIGGLRYAFVAAGWVLPWLTGSLPVRYSAKAIAAAQGIVLIVAASGLLPLTVAVLLVATALTALVWSFAQSVLLLAQRAQAR